MNLFEKAIRRKNLSRPPVWFMRQAGRYHSHYQKLRKQHSFMDLCKKPEVACEVTLGPVDEFGFDAAILFSDLLFPLEMMGVGLTYDEGPKLEWKLEKTSDLNRIKGGGALVKGLSFQAEALKLVRSKLSRDKALLGFVGGPLTLFSYAVEGTHSGELLSARRGMSDGRFTGFVEKLSELLVENMLLQARAGADAVAVFDTCAGEFDADVYGNVVAPVLENLFLDFKRSAPEIPVIYYSKGTRPAHWKFLKGLRFDCLGIDWRHDLSTALLEWGNHWAIQGNIDPQWLLMQKDELQSNLEREFAKIAALKDEARAGWICGLGHGVLQHTPEENVKVFINTVRKFFPERTGSSGL